MVVVPTSLIDRVKEICQERSEADEKMFMELGKGAAMDHPVQTVRIKR